MQFGYEDEDEQPEGDEEKEEEDEDLMDEDLMVEDLMDESRQSNGRDTADQWENDDDEDDEEYEGTISAIGTFESPGAFLNWLQQRKATGSDPKQLLLSLLDQVRDVASLDSMWVHTISSLNRTQARTTFYGASSTSSAATLRARSCRCDASCHTSTPSRTFVSCCRAPLTSLY